MTSRNRPTSYKNAAPALYAIFCVVELLVIHRLSDLPPETSNWIAKAQQIAHFQIPTDNFYGPGSALLTVPFSFFPSGIFLTNIFYLALGSAAYFCLVGYIQSKPARLVALLGLPLNFYLMWLINSSQDTVFEFFLLTSALLALKKKKSFVFVLLTFILCLTRSGYWVYFLGISAYFFLKYRKTELRRAIVFGLALPLLFLNAGFNYLNYESPSPALEGGLTAYFAYTKYHYLSLPKMDMDVFLSGPSGPFSENLGPDLSGDLTPADASKKYFNAALESIKDNKKETILGWMQKVDSYFFDAQKVPHLPGAYVLDQEKMTIKIENERLNWQLVLGNLAFEFYRSALLIFGLMSAGILFYSRRINDALRTKLIPLAAPYFLGAIPGILVYTESRFKVVSEVLLVPVIVEIWALAFRRIKVVKSSQ